MPITVDLSGVKTEFEPIPPGVYDAMIADAEEKTSKNGNPYVNIRFSVEPNEDTGFDGESAAWYALTVTEETKRYVKSTLSNLGWSDEELEGAVTIDPADLIGLECTLVIESYFYEGEERTRVSEILPPDTVLDDGTDEDMDIF